MEKLKNRLLVLAGLTLSVQVLVFSGVGQALAQQVGQQAKPLITRVLVSNTPAEPIPFTQAVLNPFQIQIQMVAPSGSPTVSGSFLVPTGKRLVIEYVSVKGLLMGGVATITTTTAGVTVTHALSSIPPTNSSAASAAATGMVRLFADADSKVTLSGNYGDVPVLVGSVSGELIS